MLADGERAGIHAVICTTVAEHRLILGKTAGKRREMSPQTNPMYGHYPTRLVERPYLVIITALAQMLTWNT